ncbi:unnamed protein product, partial [Sphacelaria rigidula]
ICLAVQVDVEELPHTTRILASASLEHLQLSPVFRPSTIPLNIPGVVDMRVYSRSSGDRRRRRIPCAASAVASNVLIVRSLSLLLLARCQAFSPTSIAGASRPHAEQVLRLNQVQY